ncbi:ATP-binding protein [Streptomyces sp. NPDC004539]|uniref:ATP-binding protein n=1 Tax=Streptomyces sp. NPDC004539 TaxID=3154280 RepID=UPI0033B3C890
MPEKSPWEYTLHLPNDPRGVTVTRRALRLILTLHGHITLVDVAELLTAELVANAVQHTKGAVSVKISWSAGVARIGVWDADPEPPDVPEGLAGELEESGRGMGLIQACAASWGWRPMSRRGTRGKYVWCELDAA